jgi:hypothetical protein
MLFAELIAVYSENHMKHTNTFFLQYEESFNVKASGTCSNHCALNG